MDAVYYMPYGQQTMHCRDIDCDVDCPPAAGADWVTCQCPGEDAEVCNATMKETSGGPGTAPLLGCLNVNACPGSTVCENTTDTPSGANPYGPNGFGYEKKFTCWCD